MGNKERRVAQYRIFDNRERVVFEANPDLKTALQIAHHQLLALLLGNAEFYHLYSRNVIHGFVPKRNSLTHARFHRTAGTILTMDLRHAFESVGKLKAMQSVVQLGASSDLLDFLDENAFLGDLMPAGFPTSSDLFNAALLPMDLQLLKFTHEHDLRYSRYADDLAFSGSRFVIPQTDIDKIVTIIESHEFQAHKIRLGHPGSKPVHICGLSIDHGRITLPEKTLRGLRKSIDHCFRETPPNYQRAQSLLGYIKKIRGRIPGSLWKYYYLTQTMKQESTAREKRYRYY